MVIGENIKNMKENKSATLMVKAYKYIREVDYGDAITVKIERPV